MGRLYWRVKKNGKWTWTPAVYDVHDKEVMALDIGDQGELVTLWWPDSEEEE